ncbi:unnamed protein product [Ixodes persulcatus]
MGVRKSENQALWKILRNSSTLIGKSGYRMAWVTMPPLMITSSAMRMKLAKSRITCVRADKARWVRKAARAIVTVFPAAEHMRTMSLTR